MTPPPAPAEGRLVAGRVGRSHGLDGSFYVTRALARLLRQGAQVRVGSRESVIVRRAGTDSRPIVRVEGVVDRAGAEQLRGQELTVARADAPTLEEGEFWAHELEGCTVTDGERVLGSVARLLELPSCEVLEVRPADGGEPLLVPLVHDAVRSISTEQRRIDVSLDFLDPEPPPAPRSEPA